MKLADVSINVFSQMYHFTDEIFHFIKDDKLW